MKLMRWLSATLFFVSTVVQAHGPTPQKVEERVSIARPPAEVWAMIREFGGVNGWNPFFTEVRASNGNEPGKAEREVTLSNGGKIKEGLDEYEETRRYMGYRLAKENIEAFPVSFYSITIEVKAVGDGSEVEWLGRFYRADTGNFPPENLNDEAAVEAMTIMARTGLDNLKTLMEGGSP